MNSLGIIVRRALNRARQGLGGPGRLGRLSLTLAVAAGLAGSALGPISSVRADPPPVPAARLQVVVQKIHINNDRDGWGRGSGEMRLFLAFCKDGDPLDCRSEGTLMTASSFSADTGDTVTVGHVLPDVGDPVTGAATPETGFPVYPGEHWVFRAGMFENDTIGGDDMGDLRAHVDAEHGWGLGTFTSRSIHGDGSAGDFDVTFEIRRVPMPLLRINIVRETGAGAEQAYCVVVDNIGPQPALLSPVSIKADGVLVREANLGAIGSNEAREHCVLRSELPAREHTLRFVVDESDHVPELEDFHYPYDLIVPSRLAAAGPETGPVVAASPEPAPIRTRPDQQAAQSGASGSKADLTVRAILVNGQVPDGKNACKTGHTDLTVTVKNMGEGDAGSFAVRLSVDGDTLVHTVDDLRAGDEREVSFENVPLKKGEHILRATADPDHTIDEANDRNNELKLSVRCGDAG